MRKNILLNWWNRTRGDRDIRDPQAPSLAVDGAAKTQGADVLKETSTAEVDSSDPVLPERLAENGASYESPGRPAERKKMDANLYQALSG